MAENQESLLQYAFTNEVHPPLHLTKTLMCNSEFGISRLVHYDTVLDSAVAGHRKMDKKIC